METPKDRYTGLVAILDALGASTYSDPKIDRFVRSLDIVLDLLDQKAEEVLRNINKDMISTFTFNDTVLITRRTAESGPTLNNISSVFLILRKFFVDSLIRWFTRSSFVDRLRSALSTSTKKRIR
jgi:hypothetical protein